MTPEDAKKINAMYADLDRLNVENASLKGEVSRLNEEVLTRLDSLKDQVCACCKED